MPPSGEVNSPLQIQTDPLPIYWIDFAPEEEYERGVEIPRQPLATD